MNRAAGPADVGRAGVGSAGAGTASSGFAAKDRRRAIAAVLAGIFVFGLLWFWTTLGHGPRSDDYLLTYYTDRTAGEVRWPRVWHEFRRGWFGDSETYRPLVSVSVGIEQSLGLSAHGSHTTNLLAILIAAMATAAAAASLCARRYALAAGVAGMTMLLHPATVEPAAWISARTAGLQVAFSALTMWLFCRRLMRQERSWAAVLTMALGLGCREGAVLLPVSLLAIDLLFSHHSTLAQRWRRHWPFWVVLVLYFLGRGMLFGRIMPPVDEEAAHGPARNALVRTAQLLLPPDGAGTLTLWALPLLGIALMPVAWRTRKALLVLPAWLFLLQMPSSSVPVDYSAMSGRLVFDGVASLALVAGVAAATATRQRTAAIMVLVALAGFLWASAMASWNWIQRYDHEDQLARTIERELASSAAASSPEHPFAFTALPGLPLFHHKLWGALGLRPTMPRDLPVLGLPDLLFPDASAPLNWNDAAPVAALQAAGGTLAKWNANTLKFESMPTPTAAEPRPLVPDPLSPRTYQLPSPVLGPLIAAVEVRLPRPALTCRLRLLDDLPGHEAFGWLRRDASSGRVWFPLVHAVPPLLAQSSGHPFRGCHIEVDDGDPQAGTTVLLHATVEQRPVPQPHHGPQTNPIELRSWLRRPPLKGPARLYVMLPTGVRFLDMPEQGRELSWEVQQHLDWTLRIFGPTLVTHWFWHSQPSANEPPWRTPLEWAIVTATH